MTEYLSAQEAAARLGVSRQTLYAYVSRGLLRAHESSDPRQRRYSADAVVALGRERRRARRPQEVAKATLDFGMPVMESAITLIQDGRLFYRGQDATRLAETASVERVAAILWDLPEAMAFGPEPPPTSISAIAAVPMATTSRVGSARTSRKIAADTMSAGTRAPRTLVSDLARSPGYRTSGEELLPRFAAATRDDPTALWRLDERRLAAGCAELTRLMLACVTGVAPSARPLHAQLADAWGLDGAGADLVRMALVLCADHELNASSFTARCIASTGASLRAAVIGGLTALSGPRHGGATTRIESFWRGLEEGSVPASLRERLAAGEELPGFGHPLYPEGDPRAIALLARILPNFPAGRTVVDAAAALTGLAPNIDFALVAMRRFLNLPEGAAFSLFALGRTLGWIAHAIEQRRAGQLIRPRAVYVGKPPGAGAE